MSPPLLGLRCRLRATALLEPPAHARPFAGGFRVARPPPTAETLYLMTLWRLGVAIAGPRHGRWGYDPHTCQPEQVQAADLRERRIGSDPHADPAPFALA